MAPDVLTTTRLVCQLSTLQAQEETFLIRQNIVLVELCDKILPKVKVFDCFDALADRDAIQGYELVIVNTGTEGFKDLENLWERQFPSDLFNLIY
jgi:hypothetical protein